MPKRAMKWLPAMLGACIAGFAVPTISEAAVEAKDCLAAPGKPTPGGHWHYRIDRATKRHCWYVRTQDQADAQLASAPAQSAQPPAVTPLQPAVANARAEIAAAPEAAPPDGVGGSSPATVADGGKTAVGTGSSNGPPRTLAERWSDHPSADAPAQPASSLALAVGRQPLQATPARPVDGSGSFPIWRLLSALAGALALVGAASALIVKFGRRIIISDHDDRGRNGMIPGHRPGDDISAPVHSADEIPMSWIRIAREAEEARRRAEEVEQLLARGRTAA